MVLANEELIGLFIREITPVAAEYAKAYVSDKRIRDSQEIQLKDIREKKLAHAEDRLERLKGNCPSCRDMRDMKLNAGHNAWILLHSTADSYPLSPAIEVQERTRLFIYSIVANFPCVECAENAMQHLDQAPLNFSSRAALQRSLCEFHNHVSAQLGKPIYQCLSV